MRHAKFRTASGLIAHISPLPPLALQRRIYLRQHTLEEAIVKMRDGINKLNNTSAAYHEAITQVWTKLIHAAMATHDAADCAWDFFDQHSYFLDSTLLMKFYSDEHLMSHGLDAA